MENRMIPENIKRLISSSNREDHEIGIILARDLNLKSKEFQKLVSCSLLSTSMLDIYIARSYTGNLEDPYSYFEYKYSL